MSDGQSTVTVRRRRRGWWPIAADLGLMLVIAPFVAQDLLHPAHPVMLLAAADLVLVAPLGLRRRRPVGVFWLLLAIVILLSWWDFRLTGSIALPVALYAVAAYSTDRHAIVATAALTAASVLAAWLIGGAWWTTAVALTGVIAAAAALGLWVRARRDLIDRLRSDVARLAADRDRQAALLAAQQRAELARDIHDIVAHHLTVIVAMSDAAVRTAATAPQDGLEAMTTVADIGRQALSETRALLGALPQPAAGSEQIVQPEPPAGDCAALPDLIDVMRAAGLRPTLRLDPSCVQLPPGAQLIAYRVVQEALTNALKHAGQDTNVEVDVHPAGDTLVISVTDDGAGTPSLAQGPPGGRGLPSLKVRLRLERGQLNAGPHGHGWRVQATLPRGLPIDTEARDSITPAPA